MFTKTFVLTTIKQRGEFFMSETISKKIYKQIDEERIIDALEDGNWDDAFVLFKYSVLTKEEFSELQQLNTNYGAFEKQMKDYVKKTEMEKLEKAFRDGKDKEAEVLFYFSDHLTVKDFTEIKRKWRVPNKEEMELTEEQVDDNWKKILEGIKAEISKPSFDTWFRQTKGELVDGVLVIGCANEFQLDWLETRYSDLILEVAEKIFGTKYNLRFVNRE